MFSQDSNLERGANGQNPETGIFSNNFGGLNKIASSLNVPFEDSPDLLNVEVDVSGNILKRKGTRNVYWNKTPGTVKGASCIPFTTGLGYNLVVIKNNLNLELLEVVDDKSTVLVTKTNVFTAEVASTRINYVSTNEIEPRLIITSGFCPPVQLKFVEQQKTVTAAGTSTVIDSADRYRNAATTNLIVYKNRVRQAGVSISYNVGTGQLTLGNMSVSINDTIDIILVCWQWWAEAFYWLGERFSGTSTRSNSTANIDKVVTIPPLLRDNMELMAPNRPLFYPVEAYAATDFDYGYIPSFSSTPANRAQYAFTDGAPYNGQGISTPSPLFITFGGLADGTACDVNNYPAIGAGTQACPSSMPVIFTRKRGVSFNGNRGINNSQIHVYINGNLIPLSTNFVSGTSGMGSSFYTVTQDLAFKIGTTNSPCWGIDFTSGSQVGLPASAKVEAVNPIAQYLGSGATNNRGDSGNFLNSDGSWIPAYGFGDFADYGSGSFPTNVALYQGRLAFSGFLNNSLRMVFSNQFDSVIPGKYFANYQLDAQATAATDAFDLTVSSAPDDVTKGLIEWQQSLFLLTRKAVFRIYGGNNASITGTNRLVVLVSSIGLINSYSVCRTDKSILYLSDTGVYDLSTSLDSSEYVAGDKSLKIRPVFGLASSPAYEPLPWMAFDGASKLVYLGYPEEGFYNYSTQLFVYNTFRESWTEYYTQGNFCTYVGSTFVDRSLGVHFGLLCNTYRLADDTSLDLMLIRTNYHRYVDYAQETIGTGAQQSIEIQTDQVASHITSDNIRHYGVNRKDTKQAFGFRPLPMTDVEDIAVFLETGVGSNAFPQLTFNVDWRKLPDGKVYLMANPGAGKRLFINPRLPVTDSPQGNEMYILRPGFVRPTLVYVDNVFTTPDFYTAEYFVAGTLGTIDKSKRIKITVPANSVIVTGEAYPCYYTSPIFTQEMLASMKRTKYILAYFDNQDGMQTYNPSDVNTASGQVSTSLVGYNKQRLNANISIRYEEDDFTSTVYDNYGYNDLIWDDNLFDINAPNNLYQKHVLFKEALQGVSYSYQLIVWNHDETTFRLSGYQIMANVRGTKHINWTR